MGYLHIGNLYKEQDILLFKECYALEKVHGTSAHILWKDNQVLFSAGGERHNNFVKLFDEEKLRQGFAGTGLEKIVIYGEAYGGKCQGMSDTYGKELKFVAFDVKMNDVWLSVPQAHDFAGKTLGLDFVHYVKIPTTFEAIDAERDADSVQAVRNGIGAGKKREGIVLRPLIEVRKNNDERVISKHKRDEFCETKTPRQVIDPAKLEVLAQAERIAEEWVTLERLNHVLDKMPGAHLEQIPDLIRAMIEDVYREGKGEIVESKEAEKAIGKRTAVSFKELIKNKMRDAAGT